MRISELNAAKKRADGVKEANLPDWRRKVDAKKNGPAQEEEEEGTVISGKPDSLCLQYEYELERSREISSSITRITLLIPMMSAVTAVLVRWAVTYCTGNMPARIFLILGIADILILLSALAVACTVHFYILNPAPSLSGEEEWMEQMNRDLQRGNNWRAWLVFAATILIYLSVGVTIVLLILSLIGL